MTKPFVYDEKTSYLYGPDGQFIKEVFCPKAVSWNQLLADNPQDRSRGCNQCHERIINLDATPTQVAVQTLQEQPNTCVYATKNSSNVIFLIDDKNPDCPKIKMTDWFERDTPPLDLPIISTVRNIKDIQRAIRMGYWADIRLVRYDDKQITQKFSIHQNFKTGQIKQIGDYRSKMRLGMDSELDSGEWQEVIPFTFYYANYQGQPIAAYLIPRDLPNNSEVLVLDPIEDMVGGSWNQGDKYRANNLKATVINKKVVLNPFSIKRTDFMG
jgi:hypothetical protein